MPYCTKCGTYVDAGPTCRRCAPVKAQGTSALGILIASMAVGITLVFLVVTVLSAIDPSLPAPPKTRRLTYLVRGSAETASITYINVTGGFEQHDVKLPWTKEMRVRPGTHASVTAQSTDRSHASISVAIYVDAVKLKESESRGRYVIATADGIVH